VNAIKISAADLPKALRRKGEAIKGAIPKAARAASLRLKTYLANQSDKLGITYQGTYKNGFRATDRGVVNDAPHAGIVEEGARPHKVSKEGREAIKRWCMIKLGLDEANAESASWAIAKTIEQHGQEGRHVMRKALPMAKKFFREELQRILREEKSKP
jgi:hypothetical protein